jgi:fibronectin-binding autotransporter adhesin
MAHLLASRVAAALACLTLPVCALAQTYTNTYSGGTSTTWNAGPWTGGTPVEGASTIVVFDGNNTANVTLTNDLGGADSLFDLTQISIAQGNTTTNFEINIAGHGLNFIGTNNSISLSASDWATISSNISFVNGLTISTGSFQTYTLSGVISGSGGLTKNGTDSTLNISGTNTYTGNTVLNGSLVNANNASAFSTGTVIFNAGTLASSATRTWANNFQIGGNVTLNNSNAPQDITLAGTVDLLGAVRTLTTGGSAVDDFVVLSGAVSNGGIVKGGVSLLRLTGTNTYTMGTTVTNGILQFATDASVPDVGSIVINRGGVLATNQTSGMTTAQAWLDSDLITTTSGGTLAITSNTATLIDMTGYNSLFLGAFSTTASTVYTVSGGITAADDTYRLGGGGAILAVSGDSLTGTRNLIVGPVLTRGSVGSSVIGTQTWIGGTVRLTGANSMSGTTTVNSGILSLNGAGSLANSDILVKYGTLDFTPTTTPITRAKSLNLSRGTFTLTGSSSDTNSTITGALTTSDGLSTMTLTPNSASNSRITVGSLVRENRAGLLVRGVGLGAGTIGANTDNTTNITITTGGESHFVGSTATSGTSIRVIPWAVGGTSASTNGTDFLTYDSTRGLRPLGAGETVGTFADGTTAMENVKIASAITGIDTTALLNSIVLNASGSIAGTGTVTVASGGVLATDTSSISTALSFEDKEAVFFTTNNNLTITGNITNTAGAVGLTKFGTGGLVLNGAKTYTGVTTILAGTLTTNTLANGGVASGIGASSSDAANLVLNGGSFAYNGTAQATTDRLFTLGTSNGGILNNSTNTSNPNYSIQFTNTGAIGFTDEVGPRILTLGGSHTGGINVFAGQITDKDENSPTSLLKGFAHWSLTNGNSSYTGITRLSGDANNSGGVLLVSVLADGLQNSSIGASSSDAANLVLSRATLRYVGTTNASTDRLFTIGTTGGNVTSSIESSGTGTLTFSNTGALALLGSSQRTLQLSGTNTGDNIFRPSITDSGANTTAHATHLTKDGAGTWIVAGDNSYTGNTTVTNGTLKVGSTTALGINSALSLANTAGVILSLNGYSVAVGSIAGGGTNGGNIQLGDQTLTTGGRNTNTSYAGVISGTGNLTKIGTGTQTFTRAQTYTGTTFINGGVVALSSTGSLASSVIDIGLDGTFDVSAVANYTLIAGRTIQGNGKVLGNVIVAGTLNPGASPGLLTFQDDLKLNPGSNTIMEIIGTDRGVAGGYDGINVEGDASGATLEYGGTLTLHMTSPAAPFEYDLFNITGTVTGDFASVVFTGGAYSALFTNNAGIWTASQGEQTFEFNQSTGDLIITGVPEPQPALAVLLGLAAAVVLTRRRASQLV